MRSSSREGARRAGSQPCFPAAANDPEPTEAVEIDLLAVIGGEGRIGDVTDAVAAKLTERSLGRLSPRAFQRWL